MLVVSLVSSRAPATLSGIYWPAIFQTAVALWAYAPRSVLVMLTFCGYHEIATLVSGPASRHFFSSQKNLDEADALRDGAPAPDA